MYKVLIADDERLIRITLKNMIDWKALDCEVIATAKDGVEAFDIYKDMQPEIVITDLKMPGMDGIELITRIKEVNKNTQVIALSNYSDFEYVRDAMKAGAFDYLLKVTLEKTELERIIAQVKESCVESSMNDHEEYESALKELQQCLILTKNEHILSRREFHETLDQPVFEPYRNGFQMAYFRVDNINHLYQTKLKDHAALHKHLQDLIRESMPLAVHHHLIFMSNHSGILLFESREKLRILNICNSIIRNITQYLNIHMSITLSDVIPSLDDFYDQFELLLKSHERRFYAGEGSLIQSEEHDAFQELDMNKVTFHLELLEAVAGKDFDTAHRKLKETLDYMKINEIDPHAVLEYFVFIFHNIEGNEMARGIRQAFPFDTITAKLRLCETADKLEEIAATSFDKIEAWMKDRSSRRYRQEILDVMEYINANMNRKLTLKEIADSIRMNESSLSRLFKNETGVNLNYYINEKKMKKAMELLSSESSRIKDVAAAVGMDDQLYFNKVFKKYYNVSPSEFKKKLHPDTEE